MKISHQPLSRTFPAFLKDALPETRSVWLVHLVRLRNVRPKCPNSKRNEKRMLPDRSQMPTASPASAVIAPFPRLLPFIYLFYWGGERAITTIICTTNVQFCLPAACWFSRSEWFWSVQGKAVPFTRHFNGKTGKSYLAGRCGLSLGLHYMPLNFDAFGQGWSNHVFWPTQARWRQTGREMEREGERGEAGHWRL